MQPSFIYCKLCGHSLTIYSFPKELRGRIGRFPIDDEQTFQEALRYARENIACPSCGNRKWIRKAYYKV
jgi:ribosomal protein S27E